MTDEEIIELLEERRYTSKDAMKITGISYRQINDWDSRGVLPGNRDGNRDWRRFNLKELFILMICVEIRREFGVPVERLKWISDHVNQPRFNHLLSAYQIMDEYGVPVMLLTDLRSVFDLESALNFSKFLKEGYFSGEELDKYIFMKVNPLVNRLLSVLETPTNLPMHARGYMELDKFDRRTRVHSQEELQLLELIRDESYVRIEVKKFNDQVDMFYASKEEDSSDITLAEIKALIDADEYQTIQLIKHDGRLVGIERKIPIKPNRYDGD